MKKFGRYIFFILVGLIVLAFSLDAIYTWVYQNSVPRNKVSYVLSQENKKIDYIFLGSSRVDNFIDSEKIAEITGKSALNLGVQGANVDDYYLMLQLLKKQKIETSIVFVQLDYVYNGRNASSILKSELMPYIKNPMIEHYIKERDPDFWRLKHLPFYRYLVYDYKLGFREFFGSLINKKPRVDMANGYNPKFGTNPPLSFGLPAEVAKSNEAVEKMKLFARKNGIKLVFFTSPFCGDTKNISYVNELAKKFDRFLNYAELFKDQDTYFYNGGHVNNRGAQVFSQRFAEDIVSKYQN